MENQKAENLLNLALEATEEEREKSQNLDVGYDPAERTWELIIKYDQSVSPLPEPLSGVVPLSFGYGILWIPETQIAALEGLPEVEYIEKPKRLYFAVNQGKAASCFLGGVFSGQETPEESAAMNGGGMAGGSVTPDRDGMAGGSVMMDGGGMAGGSVVTDRDGMPGGSTALDGRGVIVAVIDSGVDYFHPDFRKEDGSTRILALWDQTVSAGRPPEGFFQGTEFNREEIDEALSAGSRAAGYAVVPSTDESGHGTQVLGIAAGNGNASGGLYAGGAPGSDILVVKLGIPGETDFPRTTQLMQALEYVLRKAREYGRPAAVNLSFGNVYGAHAGTSLLETYLNEMAGSWKNVIVTGSGNEGAGRGHAAGVLTDSQVQTAELAVSEFETILNIQLWKNYADEFEVALIHPDGQRAVISQEAERSLRMGEEEAAAGRESGQAGAAPGRDQTAAVPGRSQTGGVPGRSGAGAVRFRLGTTEILAYYGKPSPYSVNQEIYLDFIPAEQYIDPGVWRIELTPRRIVSGQYDLWLPGAEVLGAETGFLRPSPEVTLTIPSTAEKVLTVGAYDSRTMSYAYFSGRGYTRNPEKVKPDLAAPGVGITTAAPGGGYVTVTGTSFAAPFATAAAAILMQWGIVLGGDRFLYGEKVKAYLRRGARPLPGFRAFPNNQVGYGTLCVRESLPF